MTEAAPPHAPPELGEDYAVEVTTESYRELGRLALFAKSMGPQFCVIGGWAAWHYHGGLGSRDIDVIFPDFRTLDVMLRKYYEKNGYENFGGLLAKRFKKRVQVGTRTVFIEIDAANVTDHVPFKEDRTRTIPYSEVLEHSREWDVGPAAVLIPRPELLVLQKVKAWRDRTWDLDHVAVNPVDIAYLRGKIRKDEYDIRHVAAAVEEPSLMWSIAEKHKCKDLVADALGRLRVGWPMGP